MEEQSTNISPQEPAMASVPDVPAPGKWHPTPLQKKIATYGGVIILILLLAVGYTRYEMYANYKRVEEAALKAQSEAEALQKKRAEVNPTDGWQTYRNEEYGYEFKYPRNLELKNLGKDVPGVFLDEPTEEEVTFGFMVLVLEETSPFSLQKENAVESYHECLRFPPQELYYEKCPDDEVECTADFSKECREAHSLDFIDFAGHDAIRYKEIIDEDLSDDITEVFGQTYHVQISSDSTLQIDGVFIESKRQRFNQILSTFKFIE